MPSRMTPAEAKERLVYLRDRHLPHGLTTSSPLDREAISVALDALERMIGNPYPPPPPPPPPGVIGEHVHEVGSCGHCDGAGRAAR